MKKIIIWLFFGLYVENFAAKFLQTYMFSGKYTFKMFVKFLRAIHYMPKNIERDSVLDHNCVLTKGVSTIFLLGIFTNVAVSPEGKRLCKELFPNKKRILGPVNYAGDPDAYPDVVIPDFTVKNVKAGNAPQGTVFMLLPHQRKYFLETNSCTKINPYFYALSINDSYAELDSGIADQSTD